MAKKSNRGLVLAGLLASAAASTALVKPWEGFSPVGYADPIGIPTDCWGNTHGARIGQLRSVAECEVLLDAGLRTVASGLADCITVELQPHEGAALLSWSYNVGVPAACGSTLVRRLNAGAPASEWCAELDRWVYAGGKKWVGLVRRRAAERAICEGRQ